MHAIASTKTAPARRKSKSSNGNNQAFPTGRVGSGPRVRRVVVTEDEYIGEVNGSTSASVPTVTAYAFNPGQSTTFPRLSIEAALYQRWIVRSAHLYYKPEVSQYATNGQSGKVMLSCQYNASLPAPATKQQIEDTRPHADGMPYMTVNLPLSPHELNDEKNGKWIRVGAQPTGTDIKTYDGGNVFVSTIGNAATTLIGELRIKYTMELVDAVLLPPAAVNGQLHLFTNATSTAAAPLTGAVKTAGSTIPATFTTSVLTLNNQPEGQPYLLTLSDSAANIASNPTMSITSGATAIDDFLDDVGSGTEATTVDNAGLSDYSFITTLANVALSFLGGTSVTGGTLDLFLTAISSLLFFAMRDSRRRRAIMSGRISIEHPKVTPADLVWMEDHQIQQVRHLMASGALFDRLSRLERQIVRPLAIDSDFDEDHKSAPPPPVLIRQSAGNSTDVGSELTNSTFLRVVEHISSSLKKK